MSDNTQSFVPETKIEGLIEAFSADDSVMPGTEPGPDWDQDPILEEGDGEDSSEEDTAEHVPDVEEEGEPDAESDEEAEEDDEESSEEDDEEDVEEEEEDEAEQKEEKTSPPKIYKFETEDGKEIEVPDNAVIKLKANGRFEKFTFKELKDHKAGKVAWDEKFDSLSEKEKTLTTKERQQQDQLTTLNNYASQMNKAAEAGDFGSAMFYFAELVGQEPSSFVRNWMDTFGAFWDELSGKSPEERENMFVKLENQAITKKNNLEKQKLTRQGQITQAESKLNQAKADFGIEDAELRESFEALKAHHNGDATKITVDSVVQLVLDQRLLHDIQGLAEKEGIEFEEGEELDVWAAVNTAKTRAGGSLSRKRMLKVIKAAVNANGAVGGKAAKTLSRKVNKRPAGKKKATPKKRQTEEPEFSSIDDGWDSLGA